VIVMIGLFLSPTHAIRGVNGYVSLGGHGHRYANQRPIVCLDFHGFDELLGGDAR
jgi:hypothetical protein